MLHSALSRDLYAALCQIPLIDPHSHIDPHRPTSRTIDDILGYHYYTELAHSAGMSQEPLTADVEPRQRVHALMQHLDRIDNTVQYSWFLEIARTFLGFSGDRLQAGDADWLFDESQRRFGQPDWENEVLRLSNIERVFLTNDFDDPLENFDTRRYIPCLRTDDLVFHLDKPEVRSRFGTATGQEAGSVATLRKGITTLFEHFTRKGAKACAISLPPDFTPYPVAQPELDRMLTTVTRGNTATSSEVDPVIKARAASGIFWILAENCRDFKLPFDLMIGVNRRVYRTGVFQGQDLFDQRTSLIQYRELFNAFPSVTFPISVLTSSQNQELVSYAWIFPNVVTSGHWWYSNIPVYIEHDLRGRLQAVPKTKQIGYYSDMYKLEFGLPKFNMYRRILASVLARDFVEPGFATETEAVALARLILRDNVERIFKV